MDKQQFQGRVTRTKLIKAEEPGLAFLELETTDGELLRALVPGNPLRFLMEVEEGDQLAVYGYYNPRGQFIVNRYLSSNKHKDWRDYPDHLSYPPRKQP